MRLVAISALVVLGSLQVATGDEAERQFKEFKAVSQTPPMYRPEVVDKPVFAVASKIAACGTTTAKPYPILKLGIAADGTVSSVTIEPTTGFTHETIECISKVMRTATFPKSKGTTASFAMLYKPR